MGVNPPRVIAYLGARPQSGLMTSPNDRALALARELAAHLETTDARTPPITTIAQELASELARLPAPRQPRRGLGVFIEELEALWATSFDPALFVVTLADVWNLPRAARDALTDDLSANPIETCRLLNQTHRRLHQRLSPTARRQFWQDPARATALAQHGAAALTSIMEEIGAG